MSRGGGRYALGCVACAKRLQVYATNAMLACGHYTYDLIPTTKHYVRTFTCGACARLAEADPQRNRKRGSHATKTAGTAS